MKLAKIGRRRLARVGVGAIILSSASAIAIADDLVSDANTSSGITTITEGGSTTIIYELVADNSGGSKGCDASIANPVKVAIAKSSAVTGPASVTFTACDDSGRQKATFSSGVAASYPISHSVSGGIQGAKFKNMADFTLTVNKAAPSNTAPSLTLPADKTVEATSASGATVSYSVSASDNEDSSVTASCSPLSGATFALGVTPVNCSVTDSGGLTTTGMFNVTVADTTAPVLDLPANKTAEATGPNGAAVSFSASANDVVDGRIAANCDKQSGDTFPLGATTVTCSATDAAGNESAQGSFSVTVRDTTAPDLSLPANKTAEATGPRGAQVSFTATSSDLVDGSVAPVCAPASGDTFPLGTTTVNCSATDRAGNKSEGSFNVTVQDTTAPVLTLPADITQFATLNGRATVNYSASANDLVDGSVSVSCSPASGSAFAVGSTTVACEATDAASNKATGGFKVNVSYNFGGFRSPIDGGDVLNVAKAGSTIPVKFSLNGDQGLSIWLNGAAPTAKSFICTSASQDAVEETSTATTSGLKYDALADQYIYNWKTSTAYANTCQQLVVRLADGSTKTANFKFTK